MFQSICIIRPLESRDIPEIAGAFAELGWDRPISHYERYLREQEAGDRAVHIAFVDGEFAGCITVCWVSDYVPFAEQGIPEITDFNVLPRFRRMGIGTQLMDRAENEIARASHIAGVGVGLTSDYGTAQRLYVQRGYIPDGRGLHYHRHPVKYGEPVTVNDDLGLYFTKNLKET